MVCRDRSGHCGFLWMAVLAWATRNQSPRIEPRGWQNALLRHDLFEDGGAAKRFAARAAVLGLEGVSAASWEAEPRRVLLSGHPGSALLDSRIAEPVHGSRRDAVFDCGGDCGRGRV